MAVTEWAIYIETRRPAGTRKRCEIGAIRRDLSAPVSDDLGLRLAEAKDLLQQLQLRMIDGFRRIAGARSAWSSVAIDPQGERLIVNFPGAGLDVAPDWITGDLLAGHGALLVDIGWRRGAEAAMQLARRLSIPIVLDADLSPDPETISLIGFADHVLFSSQAL